MNPCHILIPYATDFAALSPGGIAGCLRLFLAYRSPDHSVMVWGGHIAGTQPANLEHILNQAEFKSIVEVRNNWLPVNLQYMMAFFQQLWRARLPRRTVLYMHRTEHMLPVLLCRYKGPVVLTIHGSSRFSVMAMPPLKAWAYNTIERLVLRRAQKVLLVSADGLEYYRQTYPALREKFVHIPNPVDTGLFRPTNGGTLRRELGIAPTDLMLLYHGRMEPEKGVRFLVPVLAEVLKQRPDTHLVLVGDGSEVAVVTRLAAEAGVADKVHIVPRVDHAQLPPIVSAADVSLLASDFEGMPLSVLESLACGVPVVAYPMGDVPVLVQPGVTGMLVEERVPEAMAQVVLQVVADVDRYRASCRELALQYSAASIIPQIEQVLVDAVEDAP